MSDYVNKRIEYINNWPDVEPFEAEKNYEKRCNSDYRYYKETEGYSMAGAV